MDQDEFLEWEEKELDNELNIINLVFGAALGAYLGVAMGKMTPSFETVFPFTSMMFGVALILIMARNTAHKVRGTHRGVSITIHLSVFALGLVAVIPGALFSRIANPIFFVIFTAWFLSFMFVLITQIIRKLVWKA